MGVGVWRPCKIAAPRFAAVFRVLHRHAADPQPLIVVWIDTDLAEIHRPRIAIDVGNAGPRLALVIRTINAAVRVLD